MSKAKYILSIDQGTTGSRAIIFDSKGKVKASAYKEFRQYYPQPGWVEHDAEEIWSSVSSVIRRALKKSRINPALIAGIGITNQRETTLLWDRKTGKPVYRAIVWQCRRTAKYCQSPAMKKASAMVRRRTGLVLDPYFSGTKVRWLLDHVKGLKKRAKNNRICFGTVDSWLIWKLTGGKSHVTDMTNASRTLLFNIRQKTWDKELLKLFKIPGSLLPKVNPSGSEFGQTIRVAGLPQGIPICAVLGDQQAALYGQGCFLPGNVKNTYGTGCFLVLNTGKKFISSRKGLLTTLASDGRGQPVYALEGAIFIAGAVMQWLRDELGLFKSAADSEKMIKDLKDNDGVYIVPAFTGLGAPYWDPDARGIICGLTRGTNKSNLTRAALESIAYQTKDVFDLMRKESGYRIAELKVDGGACANNFLMQFQSDILNTRINRPVVTESTAYGAALLAGVTAGLWSLKKDIPKMFRSEKVFRPRMKNPQRLKFYSEWQRAVDRARSGHV